MPVKFEWQADQEHEWTEEQAVTPGGGTAVFLRQDWRIWLVLLGLFIIIGGVAYVLLNRRATATSNRIADDVLTVHHLLAESVARQDYDLFASLVFPYSRDWPDTQLELLNRQLFWDRVPLGLWAVPHLAGAEPQITLAPDLQTAVVETELPYIVERSPRLTETVTLVNTAVYELDEGRWRLAPPDDAFWGQTITEEGSRLDVSFPARDVEVGQRLAADLDGALADFCRLPDSNCAPGFRLRLLLEADYAQLLALGRDFQSINPRRVSGGMISLRLPTPTLVGRPIDEAGYQALYRGYAGWVTAVLSHEFNRSQMPDYQLIAQILDQIGLRPPPPRRERPWQTSPRPPIPYPEQDILTVCEGTDRTLEIWQFSLADSTWTELTDFFVDSETPPPDWGILRPMPGGEGAVLILTSFSAETGQLYLWRDGAASRLLDNMPGFYWVPSFYLLPAVPADRFLTFYEAFYENARDVSGQITISWLDLTACPGPACQLQSGESLIYQSPGGEHSLLLRMNRVGVTTLLLGDGKGQVIDEIGPGWSPLWLDEDTFVYVRPDPALDLDFFVANSGEMELVLAEAADLASARVVVTSTALRDSLPEVGRPVHLGISSASPHSHQPDSWIIHTTTSFNTAVPHRDYWFSFNEQSGEIVLLMELESEQVFAPTIEGNGRYLTVMSLEEDLVYIVHDLEHQQTGSYPTINIGPTEVDWSADANWFVLPGEGMLRLVAPGSGYERSLFYEMKNCVTAVWVNR